MFQLICLFGYTVNIVYAFETTWTHLIAFFVGFISPLGIPSIPFSRCQSEHEGILANPKQLAQRLFTATYYVWIAYLLPMVRPYMIAQTLLIVVPSALWISSIHVDYPNRLGLIWVAICLGINLMKDSVQWLPGTFCLQ